MSSETVKTQPIIEENNEKRIPDDRNGTQEYLTQVINEIDNNYKSKLSYNKKIISGFEKLDDILQGFMEGDINIIASRPAIGKTTFALTMFTNIISQGVNALYISFDKYENELLKNILSIKTRIDTNRFENGLLPTSDFKIIIDEANQLYNNRGSIFLKTFFNTDLIKLKDFIKEKIEKDKIKIVFIDYLTMIIPAPTYTNRWEQVSEISRSLKSMAMEFKIPFIVLCPIHRNIVDSSPDIIDISESGSIEYEADRVLLLYKKPKNKRDKSDFYDTGDDDNIITVYIAKNRRGPTKTFDLLFDYKRKIIKEAKSETTT
jgi:replicative DNA helicase